MRGNIEGCDAANRAVSYSQEQIIADRPGLGLAAWQTPGRGWFLVLRYGAARH